MTRSAHGLSSDPASAWWDLASCRPGTGVDPDWWTVTTVLSTKNRHAQRICGQCPVSTQCLRDNYGTARNAIIAGRWINAAGEVVQSPGGGGPP